MQHPDELSRLWGANIRRYRSYHGMTKSQLAGKLGVHPSTVLRWEDGDTEPRRNHKAALAHELGVDVIVLFPLTRMAAA